MDLTGGCGKGVLRPNHKEFSLGCGGCPWNNPPEGSDTSFLMGRLRAALPGLRCFSEGGAGSGRITHDSYRGSDWVTRVRSRFLFCESRNEKPAWCWHHSGWVFGQLETSALTTRKRESRIEDSIAAFSGMLRHLCPTRGRARPSDLGP